MRGVALVWKVDTGIDRVDRMLALAADPANRGVPLGASAVVYLVAVLEQGLDTLLNSQFPQSRGLTLRQRMREAPKLLSGGKTQLDEASPGARNIHWAIKVRNDLMHLEGSSLAVPDQDSRDPVKVDFARVVPGEEHLVAVAAHFLAGVSRSDMDRMQADPWDDILASKVLEARIAIADYLGALAQWAETHEYVGACFRTTP